MAKSTKATKTAPVGPTVAADTAMIVADFRNFGKCIINDDARTALLRRVTDKNVFKGIRVKAVAAWLIEQCGYDAKSALANVDGTLANPKAFGKGAKRTEENQKDYKDGNAAWSYYLARNSIPQLTRAPAKRRPKMAGEKDKPAPQSDTSAPPQTIQSFVVAKVATIGEVIGLFNLGKAYMNKTANANSKILVGDAGGAIRALCAHVSNELARIEALKG